MNRLPNRGFTLITILVALVITGFVAAAMAQYFRSQATVSRRLSAVQDKEDLRDLVRAQFDCAKTKSSRPSQCFTHKKQLGLYSRTGVNPFIQIPAGGTHTQVASYFLRAQCRDHEFEYQVEVSADKIQWEPLFEIPLACTD